MGTSVSDDGNSNTCWLRRTEKPIVLEVDAETARKNGGRFCKATDTVYYAAISNSNTSNMLFIH